jgi:hypothetical protein
MSAQASLSWTERPIGNVPFVASSTQKLIIPRDNAIRRVIMRFDINYTTGSTAPTYTEDDFLNLIANVRVQRNGSDNKINVSARMWYYVEDYEKGTPARKTAASSATSTTTDCFFVLIADFATFRENEHDISALLQTKNLSSLELQIDWLSNAVVATANAPTINAASTVQVDIREVSGVVPDTNGVLQDINDDTVITMANIYEAEQIVTIDANHSSFDADTLAVDVTPAPANLLKQALMVLDATSPNGNKSDTLVSEFKVQRESPFIYRYAQRKYNNILESQKMQLTVQTLVAGFLFLDWIDKVPNGLLNNRNTGDIKYRFLTTNFASGQTIRVYKRYVYVPRVQ